MSVAPTGTVTFLFSDIQGSTRLWEEHPESMRPALARHDELLRQAITDHSGHVFKTVGDAFCAAFPTAPDALAAALAAQRSLAAEPWPDPVSVCVRMALHTGAAEERSGDYFGQPLNRVARLMAAGHGGQILLSGVTQELTRDQLPASVTLRDLGQRRLKDLGRPEHVFQALHPALPADFPPLRSLDNPDLPNNLPQQVTSFIGRERQVAEIKGLLKKSRLMTLTGAGGSGKTRLCLQVTADLLDQHFDGVWLVELAALSDPALVPQAVADILGVREEPGKPIIRTLAEWLRPKRLLLLLDNCEHLIAACASLATELLRSCPDVHLLASSREALNVAGEQTYRVPSLTLPDPKQVQSVEALSQYEAVQLFMERAQAVRSDFAVTDANVPAVAQVCWRLDGIPLALELAAARVRSLSVDEINTRLDNRFRLLTGGSRTALPRQQTLRALIDWSYDLLTGAEKTLLRRLSVFAGGWTLEAAEWVCAGDGIEDFEVLDLLTGLVDRSLAVYEEEGGGGRYRLLETVRQYADDRLAEGGEAGAVQEKAAAWALALAEEAEPQLRGPETASWLSRLEAEHDNLRAALTWYEQTPRNRLTPDAAEGEGNGLRLVGALHRFWYVRGHYSEGRQWLVRALAGAGDGAAGGAASAARVQALLGAGALTTMLGDYSGGRAFLEECLASARQLGDHRAVGVALNNLGVVASRKGDYAGARALYEESLVTHRGLEDQQGVAVALSNLGKMASLQEDHGAARAFLEESLAVSRAIGDQRSVSLALGGLGEEAARRGAQHEARAFLEESLAVSRAIGDQRSVSLGLGGLGNEAAGRGAYDEARGLYAEGLTIARQTGDTWLSGEFLNELASLARMQGELKRAARLSGAYAALREAIGSPRDPVEQAKIDEEAAAAREILGGEAFAAAFAEGRAMTQEKAVEYALSEAP